MCARPFHGGRCTWAVPKTTPLIPVGLGLHGLSGPRPTQLSVTVSMAVLWPGIQTHSTRELLYPKNVSDSRMPGVALLLDAVACALLVLPPCTIHRCCVHLDSSNTPPPPPRPMVASWVHVGLQGVWEHVGLGGRGRGLVEDALDEAVVRRVEDGTDAAQKRRQVAFGDHLTRGKGARRACQRVRVCTGRKSPPPQHEEMMFTTKRVEPFAKTPHTLPAVC